MKFYNPKGIKNISQKTIDKHTFECAHCHEKFVNVNIYKCKFCSPKCAADYRNVTGWSPSEHARLLMSERQKGQKKSRKFIPLDEIKGWLEENYINKGLSTKECATILGCCGNTVIGYLREFGFTVRKKVRTRFDMTKRLAHEDALRLFMCKGWFYTKYFIDHLSTTSIAKECNVGRTTIKRWVKKHGFKARDNSEAHVGIKRSAESCSKQSLHLSQTFSVVGWGRTKLYGHTRNDGIELKLAGTWEFETARYFDRMNIKYITQKEIEPITYIIGENKTLRYIPDFYLPDSDEYIEVKGRFDNDAQEKMRLVFEQHPEKNISIWLREDLVNRGILKVNQDSIYNSGYYKRYQVK